MITLILFIIKLQIFLISGKYIEGRIKTHKDWIFLTRFCFISKQGQFEYQMEFDRKIGEPKLLLYYDEPNQWPGVYKTGKTCSQKLSALSITSNQIITLSARAPYSFQSGCILRSKEYFAEKTTQKPQMQPVTKNSEIDNIISLNSSKIFPESLVQLNISYNIFIEEFTTESNDVETTKKKEFLTWAPIDEITKIDFTVTCNSSGGFLSARNRWWYIAISNCGSKYGIDIKYKFRMTNGPQGDFWHEHFSADEMYISPILLTQSLTYTFLLMAIFVCSIELKTKHLLHCTYRLFGISAMLQYFGIMILGVAWAKYAIYGVGPFTTIGTMFQGASDIVYLILLLLLAKGYTVTRARISICSTIKFTVFINVYCVTYISLFIYREEVFDPGEVLNLYESPAGLGLALLRCIAWCAFLQSTIRTVRKYPEKIGFFLPFSMLGSLWILGVPFVTLTGIYLFDPWVRESIVYGFTAFLTTVGHSTFLWLTWPSRANQSFPYHIRTNHVAALANASDETSSIDYPRHIYELSPENQPQTVDGRIFETIDYMPRDKLTQIHNMFLAKSYYQNGSTIPSKISNVRVKNFANNYHTNYGEILNENDEQTFKTESHGNGV
ncbi:transmembrane protein 145-like [Condylostylus longicornis]|uniref:transmembrane protein 145-like n=1 Tax=Condylostylus longicornis TaxID=2530218 RepID=UPI00244DA2F0|nr:transmembrane protein 145-like [Condylostylus longicornis]